jgi:hypothetical protein
MTDKSYAVDSTMLEVPKEDRLGLLANHLSPSSPPTCHQCGDGYQVNSHHASSLSYPRSGAETSSKILPTCPRWAMSAVAPTPTSRISLSDIITECGEVTSQVTSGLRCGCLMMKPQIQYRRQKKGVALWRMARRVRLQQTGESRSA